MKINCNIDGQNYSFISNADKPLNKILQEAIPSFAVKNKCLNSRCGNCLVLLDGKCTISCLVPAFKINGTTIETFESFKRTKAYHDIEKAFEDTGNHPCSQCYASKVLLIESILQRMEKKTDATRELIAQEMSINNCQCLETSQMEIIIHKAFTNRSKRNGRKA